MSLASTGGHPGDLARLIDRRPFESPVGLKMVVPGWPQFSWGQRQRGWVLVGSFAIALAVGLWTWGTWWAGVSSPLRSSPRSLRPRTCCGKARSRSIRVGPHWSSSRAPWHCCFIFPPFRLCR